MEYVGRTVAKSFPVSVAVKVTSACSAAAAAMQSCPAPRCSSRRAGCTRDRSLLCHRCTQTSPRWQGYGRKKFIGTVTAIVEPGQGVQFFNIE